MTAELIDRKRLKAEAKALLADAEVPPKAMVALYLGLCLVLNLLVSLSGSAGILGTFVNILTTLLGWVLGSGFVLYCMAVRRGERAEFLTLFDGFSFVGKIIGLNIVMSLFIFLWSLLFAIPGIIAAYRYRFALYNLYENPGIGIMEALDMSKRQTLGYKAQLFTLDLSYLGWGLLGSVPTMVYTWAVYWKMMQSLLAHAGSAPLLTDTTVYLGLPDWAWTLVIGLWSLVVALFYLTNYQCVELGFFDAAKRTSGVGAGAAPESPWSGPDGLGGF